MQSLDLKEEAEIDLEVESDFEDLEFYLDSRLITKQDKTSECMQPESKPKPKTVRINTELSMKCPLPTVMMSCATYRMPSHYYSLPKYEWTHFHFLQPVKSALKPITRPLSVQPNPSSVKHQKVDGLFEPLVKPWKLPSIEKLSKLFPKPLQEPPTWPEIFGPQFPLDPPMSRLLFTRSPTKLLMPLATSPKPSSPIETTKPPDAYEPQTKNKQKFNFNHQLPITQPYIKVTKGRSVEIDPMKVNS